MQTEDSKAFLGVLVSGLGFIKFRALLGFEVLGLGFGEVAPYPPNSCQNCHVSAYCGCKGPSTTPQTKPETQKSPTKTPLSTRLI